MNFAGGEPFLIERGKYLGELLKYCKKDLKTPICSIVSNGSLIREKWFHTYGLFVYNILCVNLFVCVCVCVCVFVQQK